MLHHEILAERGVTVGRGPVRNCEYANFVTLNETRCGNVLAGSLSSTMRRESRISEASSCYEITFVRLSSRSRQFFAVCPQGRRTIYGAHVFNVGLSARRYSFPDRKSESKITMEDELRCCVRKTRRSSDEDRGDDCHLSSCRFVSPFSEIKMHERRRAVRLE